MEIFSQPGGVMWSSQTYQSRLFWAPILGAFQLVVMALWSQLACAVVIAGRLNPNNCHMYYVIGQWNPIRMEQSRRRAIQRPRQLAPVRPAGV